jgi:uncharacterized protein
MSRRAIKYLGQKAGLHPILALVLVVVTTSWAGWAAWTRLNIEMDVATLLPEESEVYQNTKRMEDEFGLKNFDFLLCTLEIRKGALKQDGDDPAKFLKEIKQEVEEAFDDPRFFRSRNKRLESRQTLSVLEGNDAALVALLTTEDFPKLSNILTQGWRDRVKEISAQFADDPSTDTVLALQVDPFGIDKILRKKMEFSSGPLKANFRDGAYLSEDNRMMLLELRPVAPSTNLVEARDLLKFVTQTRKALFDRNPGWRNTIKVNFSGPHVLSAEGTSDARQDLLYTSLLSFAGVLFLFFVAFRQPEALFYIALPLIVGVIWTLGLTSLFVNRITQVTLIFAAIIIGLGIDFSIHLYSRYLENIRIGRPAHVALSNAIMNTGPSIMAGAITTGVAFFGMSLTRFQGFRELGMFGGVGILMSLLAAAIVLPPLMLLFSNPARRMRGPLATLGLKKVTFTVQSYPRMTVAGGMCIMAFLGFHARDANFNVEFQSLRQPTDSYTKLIRRIDEHFEMPTSQVLVFAEGRTLEEALSINDQIYSKVNVSNKFPRAQKKPLKNPEDKVELDFVGIDSLRTILPSARMQMSNLDWFETDSSSIESQIRSIVGAYPDIPKGFFDPALERLNQIRASVKLAYENNDAPIQFNRMINPEFTNLVRRFLVKDDEAGVYIVMTRIYPPMEDQWVDGIPAGFFEHVISSDSSLNPPTVLGNAVLSTELQKYILQDLTILVIFIFISIISYLTWHFRSLARAGLAMVPVAFSLLCLLGIMQLLGMELNYLNVIAIPMIVGIGVDSGIHLMARFYEGEKHNMRLAIEKTGRAIVITSMTTIFGFGALSIASFKGIREIGLLAIIGTVCTLFATLLLLPAILRMLDPKYTYRGGPGDEIG